MVPSKVPTVPTVETVTKETVPDTTVVAGINPETATVPLTTALTDKPGTTDTIAVPKIVDSDATF